MKQKVFDYIEELERKAKESEKYFKLWHEEKVKNNKAIEILEKYEVHYRPGELYLKDILLDILKEGDK